MSMDDIRACLTLITHEQLRAWAGIRVYQRGCVYVSHVSSIMRTRDNRIVAWVDGQTRYVTTVGPHQHNLLPYDCSCPYDGDGPCKHVVALLLATTERIETGASIPVLKKTQALAQALQNLDDSDDDAYDDSDDDAYDDSDDDAYNNSDDDAYDDSDDETYKHASATRIDARRLSKLEAQLTGMSREDLVALVRRLAIDIPGVARDIEMMGELPKNKFGHIVSSLRRDIARVTSEDAWYDGWNQRGHIPDYSGVRRTLRMLLETGHADLVFGLAMDIWEPGMLQVESSNDEGMTGEEITTCMRVILDALPKTSLSRHEQLLWLIQRQLEDRFDLFPDADAVINDTRYTSEDWLLVTRALALQLDADQIIETGPAVRHYDRAARVLALYGAFQHAGLHDEALALLEREADTCQLHERLVTYLRERGERTRARQWCIDGYARTIATYPGIAIALMNHLKEIATEEGRLDLAASYAAEFFLSTPSIAQWDALHLAADRLGVWSAVRTAVLTYLQTGERPRTARRPTRAWPLPPVEVDITTSTRRRYQPVPDWCMLIRLAIHEQRHDDAIALYREAPTTAIRGWSIESEVAAAVAVTHPDVSLEIWNASVVTLINQVKASSYLAAIDTLREMRAIYRRTNRMDDWEMLLLNLRIENKRRPRFISELDLLEKEKDGTLTR